MTDFSKTITNTLSIIGKGEPSLWGVAVWGVDKWGTNGDLLLQIVKTLDAGSISFSNALTISSVFNQTMSSTLTLTSAMGTRTLTDGSGYTYIVKGSTNLQNSLVPSYTAGASAATGWTAGSDPSNIWS